MEEDPYLVVDTRQITYQGSGPFLRTLVQALEGEGVTVAVRRQGPYVGEHRQPPGMGDAVNASLVATGTIEAISAGVWTFRHRFADRAAVIIEDDEPLPPAHGRHRV